MAGANSDVVNAMTTFGREIGAVAQIENDVGDVLPEAGEEGMVARKTDITLRKPTMPIIFTLRAEEGEPNALQRAYSEPPGTPIDEETMRRAIVEAGGVQFGRLLMEVHLQNARTALEKLERLNPGAREILSPLVPLPD
jgi:geranylgeranyl pyrophosphate synthase